LKDRLRKWKINTKNIKESDMLEIARVRLKRMRLKAKPSVFYDKNEKLVKEAKIDRFLRRNNISDSSLLSIASPADGKSNWAVPIVLRCTLSQCN
jgi:hypothetical protein